MGSKAKTEYTIKHLRKGSEHNGDMDFGSYHSFNLKSDMALLVPIRHFTDAPNA